MEAKKRIPKIRLRKDKVENDRLEELKEEFKQWKKEQREWRKKQAIKEIKNDDDKLEWYCYVVPFFLITISLLFLLASFWWL